MKACRFERAVLLSLYLVKLLVFEKFYLDEGVQIGEGYAFESVLSEISQKTALQSFSVVH